MRIRYARQRQKVEPQKQDIMGGIREWLGQQKTRRLIMFACAVLATSLSISFTSAYTNSVHANFEEAKRQLAARYRPSTSQTTPVVVMARALRSSRPITPTDLVVKHWPSDSAPKRAFGTVQSVFAHHTTPIRALTDLNHGEVFLSRNVQKVTKNKLAFVVPNNHRAVTIKVNEIDGVGGFVKPNDRVDVILTTRPRKGGKDGPSSSEVLLQGVLVLAIDQTVGVHAAKPKVAKSITLAVMLDQAQKLALARTVGSLSLALRNTQEKTNVSTRKLSLNGLSGVRSHGHIRVVIHRAGIDGQRPPKPEVIVMKSF